MVSQGRRAANVGPVHGVCMYLIGPVASNWSRCLFRTGYQFVMGPQEPAKPPSYYEHTPAGGPIRPSHFTCHF